MATSFNFKFAVVGEMPFLGSSDVLFDPCRYHNKRIVKKREVGRM